MQIEPQQKKLLLVVLVLGVAMVVGINSFGYITRQVRMWLAHRPALVATPTAPLIEQPAQDDRPAAPVSIASPPVPSVQEVAPPSSVVVSTEPPSPPAVPGPQSATQEDGPAPAPLDEGRQPKPLSDVQIFRSGQLPVGPRYSADQAAQLVGRSFDPLTAFLTGTIDVYKVGSRLWLARPAGGFDPFSRVRVEIVIPYDTPPQLIGKTLRISLSSADPLELLSVRRDGDGTIVVRARSREQVDVGGRSYPPLD